ncbi:MAG: glycosyltransferase [Actinophytocola sp.]|nr:glycosyltransferase [Actinophytocola sp.]
MRIAIVAESFLPQVNGVSNTVRHLAEQLSAAGHSIVIVAPGPGDARHEGIPVVRVRSVPLPFYREFPVGLPDKVMTSALARFAPDVVHLASPAVLGAAGLRAARRLGVPTVAVFQTDLAGFARQYHLRAEAVMWKWMRHVHRRADRTLAPSSSTVENLRALGIPQVHLWGRGVNLELFDPARRDDAFRQQIAPDGDVVVGYVGRLAAEKGLWRLAELADIPGIRMVIVGDGPERAELESILPEAHFTGMLQGESLARVFSSLDVFVHPGEHETFCQTVQEAQASGVAAIAPAAGGPVDLIEHGRNGLLYDPADPAALRHSVMTAVRDAGLRKRLSAAARERVRDRTWARTVDDLVTHHYTAVLDPVDRAA